MNDWNTVSGKKAIVRAVFEHLRKNPQDVPQLLDYGSARELVTKIGDTNIPNDVRVFGLPFGDKDRGGSGTDKGVGSSLILEIPPDDVPIDGEEILTYACTYSLW